MLEHSASEVAKAAISYCKVGLLVLPPDSVRPLLPRLVPPMLTWCTNKHPHLKTQVRYIMERLVKRFGHEEVSEVTPEAHQRLLTHLRKQRVRSHNHAAARRAERDERLAHERAAAGGDAAEAEARRERHAEYEALMDDEAGSDDEGGGEAGGERGSGLEGVGVGGRRGRKGGGGGGGGAARTMQSTWMDAREDAAGDDLLSAPLVPAGGLKRRRGDQREVADGRRGADGHSGSARVGASRAVASRASEGEDAGVVRMDEAGKLLVMESGAAGAMAAAAAAAAGGATPMDDDDDDDDGNGRGRAKKRRRREAEDLAAAGEAESGSGAAAAPGRALGASAASARGDGAGAGRSGGNKRADEWNKRRVRGAAVESDHFGAQLGEQFAGKKGAAGDAVRKGAGAGVAPYAYLPLNPRLLGKKQQKKAAETMGRLMGRAATKVSAGLGIGKKKPRIAGVAKHGLQARRGRKSKK